MMLLVKARSDVMLAHCVEGGISVHYSRSEHHFARYVRVANGGQTSFGVNAPLGAARYGKKLFFLFVHLG